MKKSQLVQFLSNNKFINIEVEAIYSSLEEKKLTQVLFNFANAVIAEFRNIKQLSLLWFQYSEPGQDAILIKEENPADRRINSKFLNEDE